MNVSLAGKAISSRKYGELQTSAFQNGVDLGLQAAEDVAAVLNESLATRREANIILATGNSQLDFIKALRERTDIAWDKVRIFHMDEYLGMSERHPASFRRYLRKNIVNAVKPLAFYGIQGDLPDIDVEMQRYAELLQIFPADACVLGIGENGHLAFNDPPADFATRRLIHIVTLDEACRRQQVGEGHFPNLEATPKRAITLTVPALLRARYVFAVVPEARKAPAVKAALEGPVTPNVPASILQQAKNARAYLDRESASQLS